METTLALTNFHTLLLTLTFLFGTLRFIALLFRSYYPHAIEGIYDYVRDKDASYALKLVLGFLDTSIYLFSLVYQITFWLDYFL